MNAKLAIMFFYVLLACSLTLAADGIAWWNTGQRLRTTVIRSIPYRDNRARPVETTIDFPLLLERAGIPGEFDPASVRVIERAARWPGREAPFAYRTELDPKDRRERAYLTWIAKPRLGQVGVADVYFDTKDRGVAHYGYDPTLLPPENLLTNPGFDNGEEPRLAGWTMTPEALVRFGRFEHTTGKQSLKIVVDGDTPKDAGREVTISQRIDVRRFAGQEMVFQCDLLAERAAYGAPVTIELQQFREDGSRILECAVQPRWLTVELPEGQLVQFSERGRFSHEAATVNVLVRVRCYAKDADTRETITGPESFYTVWLDRLVVRPGERWSWPPASNAGFVEGALEKAPLNRGFDFTGQRRLAFNGASEATLTAGKYNPNPKSAHWGLQAGTLEFWCRPSWNSDDGAERIFFDSQAYGHRLQSRLRKLAGKEELELTIADAGCTRRTVRGPASLKAGQWHHIAATWDFPSAQLQLFVDGKRVAAVGPGDAPWLSSTVAEGGEKKSKGIGVMENDTRSLPMQAFIGGDQTWRKDRSAEAVLDEFRISDIPRYKGDFTPQREEFKVDEHTRALFHFENERDGIHDSDDRFVRGHLACELPPQEEKAPLEILNNGKIERRMVLIKPRPSDDLFEANRAENRLTVTRPFRQLPDPRFVEYREREIERTVTGLNDDFTLQVGGDFEPLMRSVTFDSAEGSPAKTTLLPRWRANDNVVPFSVKSLAETLAPNAKSDAEKAFETFKYALQTTNYYDADYCETLPNGRHRSRVSYTLLKALNIYPFDQCGPMNHTLRKLFLAVGVSSNNASGTHHQIEQAFYDGSLRFFDLSSRVYWLDRDNKTALSRRRMEEDPYLKLRQGGDVNAWLRGRKRRATFGSAERPHNMDFPLRPGERVSICWHNEGRWFEVADNRQPIPLAKIPPYFGNGAIIYEPTGRGEAPALDNMAVETRSDGGSILRAKDTANPAALTYRAQCPYIFSDARVSGEYAAEGVGDITLSLSFDEGKNWTEVWRNPDKKGKIAADMLKHVTARYAYWLKVELAQSRATKVTDFKVRATFVASPLALPGKLSRGENRISFIGGPPAVPVKTTCRWVERYKSELGVSLSSISYYMNGDEAHRNLFIAAPDRETTISVTLHGRRLRGDISLEGLPEAWVGDSRKRTIELADPEQPASAKFTLRPEDSAQGEIRGFDVVVRDGQSERRVSAQVLAADAALVSEAENAAEVTGEVAPVDLPEASGASVMSFTGDGKLGFDLTAPSEGSYALWLRARWTPGSSSHITLALDEEKARYLRAAAMIGFTEWTDPRRAHTKMFAFFGEQYGHWSWYRIPDVRLTRGEHRLTLGAVWGTSLDALTLLPQNPTMDRAAMNLFQNWNYAPWENPM